MSSLFSKYKQFDTRSFFVRPSILELSRDYESKQTGKFELGNYFSKAFSSNNRQKIKKIE